MALTITIGSESLPTVLVVIPGTDLASGAAWEMWASYTDGLGDTQSYQVRGGSGVPDSNQVALVDYRAPVNTTVTYSLIMDDVTTVTGTTTRTYTGNSAILSMTGDIVADFRQIAAGGDPREPHLRFHATDVPGSTRPPLRLAPVAGDGGGALIADTTGADTAAMRRLMGKVCYLLHNPSRCQVPDCDIPLSEMVFVTRAPNDRTTRTDAAHRRWDLSYLLTADPEPDYRATLNTWGDVEAVMTLWSDAEAEAATWGAAEVLDWTTVGA